MFQYVYNAYWFLMDVVVLIAFLQSIEKHTSLHCRHSLPDTNNTWKRSGVPVDSCKHCNKAATFLHISIELILFPPPLSFSCLLMMCVAFREGSREGVSVGFWDGIRCLFSCSVSRVPLLLNCFNAALSLSIYPSITEKIHGLTALRKRVWQLCPQAIILKMTSLRRHEIINVSQQAANTRGQIKRFDLLFFFCILYLSSTTLSFISHTQQPLSLSLSCSVSLSQWIFRDVCWFWHLSRCFRIVLAARPSAECYGCMDTHTFRHAVAV